MINIDRVFRRFTVSCPLFVYLGQYEREEGPTAGPSEPTDLNQIDGLINNHGIKM